MVLNLGISLSTGSQWFLFFLPPLLPFFLPFYLPTSPQQIFIQCILQARACASCWGNSHSKSAMQTTKQAVTTHCDEWQDRGSMKWTEVQIQITQTCRHVSQLPDDWHNLYFRPINRFSASEFLMPLQKAFLAQTRLGNRGNRSLGPVICPAQSVPLCIPVCIYVTNSIWLLCAWWVVVKAPARLEHSRAPPSCSHSVHSGLPDRARQHGELGQSGGALRSGSRAPGARPNAPGLWLKDSAQRWRRVPSLSLHPCVFTLTQCQCCAANDSP